MKITTPHGTLVVDGETRIPLTLTNPMFNEQGSHSLPFTVPWCQHNLTALGHPERVGSAYKSGDSITGCTLETSMLSEAGSLIIVDCVNDNPIQLAFITREGVFNSWANSTSLKDLSFPEGMFMSSGYIAPGLVAAHANSPYPTSYFAMFPVVVDTDGEYDYLGWSKPTAEYQNNYNKPYPFKLILNNYQYPINDYSDGAFVIWEPPRQGIKSYRLISPFLYVNALIGFIFSSAGIILKTNELTSVDELNRLCILNNSEYTLYNNKFNWDALVPDITVMEFLTAIETKLNCTRFVDFKKNEAEILFNDTLISAHPSNKMIGLCVKKSSNHSSISITHNTLSDDFIKESPFTLSNLEQYLNLSTFSMPVALDSEDTDLLLYTNDDDMVDRIVFFPQSQYVCIDRLLQNNTGEEPSYKYIYKRFRVGCLSHQRKANGDSIVEFNSKAAIAAVESTIVPTYITRKGDYPSTNHIYFNGGQLLCQRYMEGLNSIHNKYKDDGSLSDIDTKNPPLALSIYRGKLNAKYSSSDPPDYPNPTSGKQPFGSPFPYDRAGVILSESADPDVYPDTLSLQVEGEHGLYENFFRITDNFFKDSGLPIQIIHFDKLQLFRHSLKEKAIVDNVSVFISKISLTITQDNVIINTVEALTAKPYI